MSTIFVKSPKQGIRVAVGEVSVSDRTAHFYIKEKHFFQSADAVGFDASLLRRKEINWCLDFFFHLWTGKTIKLTKEEFLKHAWLYPPQNKETYKANKDVFAPKLVITMDKVEEIIKNRPTKTKDELLRQFCQQNY